MHKTEQTKISKYIPPSKLQINPKPKASRHYFIMIILTLNHPAQQFLGLLFLWQTLTLITLSSAKSSGRYAVEQHSICLLTWQIH